MRVYVSTSFANKEEAKEVMEQFRSLGFTISHDWTEEKTEGESGESLKDFLQRCAVLDFQGVQNCDLFFLINDTRAKGAFTELGMAIAYEKAIIITRHSTVDNIFSRLVDVMKFETIQDGISAAVGYRRGVEGRRS